MTKDIEDMVMDNFFNLIKDLDIPGKIEMMYVFIETYISYRDDWSGDGEVEMDAYTLAYEKSVDYYMGRVSKFLL